MYSSRVFCAFTLPRCFPDSVYPLESCSYRSSGSSRSAKRKEERHCCRPSRSAAVARRPAPLFLPTGSASAGRLYAVVLVVRHLVLYLHAVAVLSEDPVGHSKDATCKGNRIAGFPNPIPKGSRDGTKRDLRGSVHLDKLELHRLRW